MTLVITGHRPEKLGGYSESIQGSLEAYALCVLQQISLIQPAFTIDKIITGMALGWDQAMAIAAYTLGIPFVAAIPFAGQESKWNTAQIAYYHSLLDLAAEKHIVCSGDYRPEKMYLRNCWMIDTAMEIGPRSVVALWNGQESGGTWKCLQYANFKKVNVINVWDGWEKIRNENR